MPDQVLPTPESGADDFFGTPAPLEDPGSQPTPPGTVAPTSGSPAPGAGADPGTPGFPDLTPQEPTEPLEPKNDPRRFEYHQSRADKLQRELEGLQQYVPVARYIQQNPKILDVIEQDIKGKAGGSPEAVPVPKAPERPKKPEGYSLEEAATPGTKSHQYREQLLEYNAEVADFLVAKDQYQQQMAERRAQEDARQQMIQKQLSSVAQEAQMRYGLTPDEAKEFVEFYNDPRYEMPQLVSLFRMKKQQAVRAGGASSPMGPAPAGITPGMSGRLPSPGAPDPSMQFNADFIEEYKRMRGLPAGKR